MAKGTPADVDVYVGAMIRAQRRLKDISQDKLALAIGTTFQQVQKYERAANRVSASRLAQIAKHLDVPISTFFPPELADGMTPTFGIAGQLTAAQGGLELARSFLQMDGTFRTALLNVARALTPAAAASADLKDAA